MKATIPYIEGKFDEFNKLIFGGRLPRIPVRLSNAKTFVGQCCYKVRRLADGGKQCYDFVLRFNTRIELPEREIEDTIIHEMIHYHIALNNIKDASTHGPVFRRIMNDVNRKYGRNVSVSHKTTDEQKEQLIDKKSHWHVVAFVRLNDGRVGLKVIPRVLPRILSYYNTVTSSPEVKDVRLYMSANPFFNRFPNSSSPRVHIIDGDALAHELRYAEPLECDGRTVKRGRR